MYCNTDISSLFKRVYVCCIVQNFHSNLPSTAYADGKYTPSGYRRFEHLFVILRYHGVAKADAVG